ncbi:uncharacterized protein LOC107272643 isoform X2 [Cephus cinctus]|nr:uncharacterized protein LOC107272643 isoform X2 [Cephus cinctus]XP_015605476.1 uncharacterized protein LOC107272643 isoform X2 [Cephus cinctus]XP_024945665.1 uncharacterized protein LOC107272643 isoform X2 [Cephus cinctus]
MLLQRCIIILSIFACYTYARGKVIDCEKYPYHSQCRGSQTRKRYMSMGEDVVGEPGCSSKLKFLNKEQGSVPEHVDFNGISKSKLWAALLDSGLNADALYEAYVSSSEKHKKRNKNNGLNERRIPLQEFSSELDILDGDY